MRQHLHVEAASCHRCLEVSVFLFQLPGYWSHRSAIPLSTSGGLPKFPISFSFNAYDPPAMWKQGRFFKYDVVSEKVEKSFKFTVAFSFCKYCVAPTALKIIEWRMDAENPEKKNKNKKRKQNKNNNIRASFTFPNNPRTQIDWGSVGESRLQD